MPGDIESSKTADEIFDEFGTLISQFTTPLDTFRQVLFFLLLLYLTLFFFLFIIDIFYINII